jgi:hypothetical protein
MGRANSKVRHEVNEQAGKQAGAQMHKGGCGAASTSGPAAGLTDMQLQHSSLTPANTMPLLSLHYSTLEDRLAAYKRTASHRW